MRLLKHLFDNNRAWAADVARRDPGFFSQLRSQHAPEYLWIGCSDARVPANEIVGVAPGEMFVHRNIANQVIHSDMNMLSVLQYAIDVLKIRNVIVCGHYDCGGVQGAMEDRPHGLADNWLRHIRDIIARHRRHLDAIADPQRRQDRLCELNVIEQVQNVCHTTIVQEAWARGQELAVHGWIYSLHDGLLRDLNVCVAAAGEISSIYRIACEVVQTTSPL